MRLHCRDDSDIKGKRRLGVDSNPFLHSNRSAPNLLIDQQSVPQHASSTNGFRSHLHHLLPRHAYFRVKVHVHKVSNIPLVSGSFSVRWKFKNVHSAPGTKHRLLDRVKGRSRPGTPLTQTEFPTEHKIKSKEDRLDSDDSVPSPANSADASDTSLPSTVVSSSGLARSSSASKVPTTTNTPIILQPRPSVAPVLNRSFRTNAVSSNVLSPEFPSTSFTRLNSPRLNYTSPTPSPFPIQTPSLHAMDSLGFDIPTVRIRTPTLSSILTAKPGSSAQREPASTARGETHAAELKDHSVVWDHTVTAVLRIDVSRDSGVLAPSPLKLIVMKHRVRDDPMGVPPQSRLGILCINLAEYVDKGVVERKYLLKESKTNAILKLTIGIEHVGGTGDYIAPPLPQGEIMNGIASLLEKDLNRARVHANDKDGRPRKGAIPTSRQVSQGRGPSSDPGPSSWRSDFDALIDRRFHFGTEDSPGAKSTEALIDALFNPVITTEKEKECPFTVYIPPGGLESVTGNERLDVDPRRHKQNLEAASMYSTASSSEDTWTTARTVSSYTSVTPSDSSSSKSAKIRKLHLPLGASRLETHEVERPLGSGRSVKGWWKRRITSRPPTPTIHA